MKKLISSFLALILALGIISPSYAAWDDSKSESHSKNSTDMIEEEKKVAAEQDKMIKTVEPYVEVTESGTIQFKDVPANIYELYNLDELQKHFDNLNAIAEKEYIEIHEDLSIQKTSISAATVYGKWTYYWWGYDRYFTKSQATTFSNKAASVAGGAALTTSVTGWFPPVQAISGLSSGYFSLLSARVNAKNKNGVYISVSWVAVFSVNSL